VCAATDPAGLITRRMPVSVELAGALTRGQTVADHRTVVGEDAVHGLGGAVALVDVALGVDGPRYRELYLATLGLGHAH
jgi:pyrimidine-specific ribonucleoside hydrolase